VFDEADEITLPFGSLHQFQTILDVMENQELVLKDEPNRLSFVKKLSKMADFLGIRVADFTALKTKWLELYAYTTFIPRWPKRWRSPKASITLPRLWTRP
jgi:hypothetical protein